MKDLTVFEVENIKTYDKNGNLNEGIREIDINEVMPNPDQPRKNFDPEAIKELSKTVKKYGLIQPIVATLDRDKYIIVAGERRFRAAQMAGLKTVPVIVKTLTRKQIDEIALIENIQRQNLNPIEEANAYKKFVDDYKLTQQELATNIGKSREYVTNTMRLLGLPDEVKKISFSVAPKTEAIFDLASFNIFSAETNIVFYLRFSFFTRLLYNKNGKNQ